MLKTFFEINEIFFKMIEKVENFEGLQAVNLQRLIANIFDFLVIGSAEKMSDQIVQF
jgi:hypothetical protein